METEGPTTHAKKADIGYIGRPLSDGDDESGLCSALYTVCTRKGDAMYPMPSKCRDEQVHLGSCRGLLKVLSLFQESKLYCEHNELLQSCCYNDL